MFRIVWTSAIVLMMAAPASANVVKGGSTVGVFGGLSFPTGDFGDERGNDAGGAKTGLGVFGEYDYGIDPWGLTWHSIIGFVRNGFDDDALNLQQGINADVGGWWNVPIMSGLKVQRPVSPTVSLWGSGLLGITWFRTPSADLDAQATDGSQVTAEIESASGISFGFHLGGGATFNDKINVGLRILPLGTPEYDNDFTDFDGSTGQFEDQETSIAMIMITGGITFQ